MDAITVALGALAAASLADVLSTRAGLRTGRAYERNPLMRWFVASLPRAIGIKIAALTVVWWLLERVSDTSPDLAVWLISTAALLTARLAYRNFQLASHLTDPACIRYRDVRDSSGPVAPLPPRE